MSRRQFPHFREPVIWPYLVVFSVTGAVMAVWWIYVYVMRFLPAAPVVWWLSAAVTLGVLALAVVATRWVATEPTDKQEP